MTIARTIKFVTAFVGSFAAAATILAGSAGAAAGSEEGSGPTYVEYRDSSTQGEERSAEKGVPLGDVRTMNIVRGGNKIDPPEVDWTQICSTTGGAGNLPGKC